MIALLSDISFIIILLIPVIIVYMLFTNKKEFPYSNVLNNLSFIILILNFTLLKTSIQFGDFSLAFFWQFLIIYPLCIAALYYLSQTSKKGDSSRIIAIDLSRRQKIILGFIIVLCISTMIFGMNESKERVLQNYNQLIDELMESENPLETLVYNTITPSSLVGILPDLKEIKDGDIEVVSLPWKSTVKVTTYEENGQYTREFTYVRNYREWKLDGIFRSEGYFMFDEVDK